MKNYLVAVMQVLHRALELESIIYLTGSTLYVGYKIVQHFDERKVCTSSKIMKLQI